MVPMIKFKKYYSRRKGDVDQQQYNLDDMKNYFKLLFGELDRRHYFSQAFGFECVDEGYIEGEHVEGLSVLIKLALRNDKIWPFDSYMSQWSEDDIFDVIEFLHDYVSRPLEEDGYLHSWGDCGWHYRKFDKLEGQKVFRDEFNKMLMEYSTGFKLHKNGEIQSLGHETLRSLLDTEVPTDDHEIELKVENAINKFRKHGSTLDQRQNAVRDLADVLEKLRPDLKKVLNRKDDKALFEIANEFGIRHFNNKQNLDYDKSIWLSWMFYFYLATIHASSRFIKKTIAT